MTIRGRIKGVVYELIEGGAAPGGGGQGPGSIITGNQFTGGGAWQTTIDQPGGVTSIVAEGDFIDARPTRVAIATVFLLSVSGGPAQVTSISILGNALTFLGASSAGDGHARVEYWYLVAPPQDVSPNNYTVTFSAPVSTFGFISLVFGVDQALPFDAIATANGSGGSMALNVPTTGRDRATLVSWLADGLPTMQPFSPLIPTFDLRGPTGGGLATWYPPAKFYNVLTWTNVLTGTTSLGLAEYAVFIDDFERADNPTDLGSAWLTAGLKLVSGKALPKVLNVFSEGHYTAGTVGVGLEQFSRVTLAAFASGASYEEVTLTVRWNSVVDQRYRCILWWDPGTPTQYHVDLNDEATLLSTSLLAAPILAGDTFEFRANNPSGASLMDLEVWKNGLRIKQFTHSPSNVNLRNAPGRPGFAIFVDPGGAITDVQVASWAGGNTVGPWAAIGANFRSD